LAVLRDLCERFVIVLCEGGRTGGGPLARRSCGRAG
jgi:hypothetical protein